MSDYVLSIPAGGTINIINKHLIHAFPHPRPYKTGSYVTFRQKGSIMDRLFTIQKSVTFDPNNDDIEESIQHLNPTEQQQIKCYITERKKGFGFEKPNHPYMFWILKMEQHLDHKPRPYHGFPSHVYFSYEELTEGKKVVSLITRK